MFSHFFIESQILCVENYQDHMNLWLTSFSIEDLFFLSNSQLKLGQISLIRFGIEWFEQRFQFLWRMVYFQISFTPRVYPSYGSSWKSGVFTRDPSIWWARTFNICLPSSMRLSKSLPKLSVSSMSLYTLLFSLLALSCFRISKCPNRKNI